MGAKTTILAFADGDIRPALSGATRPDPGGAENLVRQLFPGYHVETADETTLADGVYPGYDITHATTVPGVDLFCDLRLILDRPSELPRRLHDLAAGRRIVMHGMHSVSDSLCFAVWEDGRLIRSLSLWPTGGIRESIGEPFDFELPYWAGEHPVKPRPGWPDTGPYPLPFHPLELGGAALRALFGFVVEGRRDPGDIDADSVPLLGFRVVDPSGQEQAQRDAMLEHALKHWTRRTFRRGPDGTFHEVDRSGPQ